MGSKQVIYIPLESLVPHPNNPRGPIDPATVEELTASIKEKGILEPLLVVPVRDSGMSWKIKHYMIVAGHRRYTGARAAGLTEVPAISEDYSPDEQEEIMLVENLQREDLTLLQEARSYQRLMEQYRLTQADVARRVGVGKERVTQRLGILKLTVNVQRHFDGNDMPVTAIPLLIRVENADRQERLAQMIASRRLSVPKLREMLEKEAEAAETDRVVEKSRTQKSNKPVGREAHTPAHTYTRDNAVADLERRNGDKLKYSDVLRSLDGVCDNCGMRTHAAICAACPLPQLINNLVNHATLTP